VNKAVANRWQVAGTETLLCMFMPWQLHVMMSHAVTMYINSCYNHLVNPCPLQFYSFISIFTPLLSKVLVTFKNYPKIL